MQVWVSGYDQHWNNQTTPTCLLMNTPPDIIRNDVIWIDVALLLQIIGPTVSRYEFQIMKHVELSSGTYICQYTTQNDLYCCDVDFIWHFPTNNWIHNVQVRVSGYDQHWNNQTTPTCLLMNTPPDIILHDVMWIDVALSLKDIGPTVSRYEFQVINHVGIIKWHR